MDDSAKSRMSLLEVLSRQWQVPLFVVSMMAFVVVLLQLRPEKEEIQFETRLDSLRALAYEGRYHEFYEAAELVRYEAQNETELGQVYYLVANTRVKELFQRHELGISPGTRRGARENYENIIRDYKEAFLRETPASDTAPAAEGYEGMGLAYWSLNKSDMAIAYFEQAIELNEEFPGELHRDLVEMYLSSRPKNYMSECMGHLEKLLTDERASDDDKAWAFVREIEVLILQGYEAEALAMLQEADDKYHDSKYGDELDFLEGLALRHTGQSDEADTALRNLLGRLSDRGDIYARSALLLGKINYEQYRYHDAKSFYELVVQSQAGKDWYVAGKVGLAQCAALHENFGEAIRLYQDVVDLLIANGHNRAIDVREVQRSLAMLAHQLGMLRQYDTALGFLAIEQQVANVDDIDAVHRFARMHDARAQQLRKQLEEADGAGGVASELAEESKATAIWLEQQQSVITEHLEMAAEQFLRVVSLAAACNDNLYDKALQRAAKAYDQAGNVDKAIEVWSRYVTEREGQPYWPFALFHLAQMYQAVGDYATAISTYEMLLQKHPRLPAAFDSLVPMARCHLSLEPPKRDEAERLLQSVLNDRALTPTSVYFRDALFELGSLYYNGMEYSKAITIMTQAIDRYTDDKLLGNALFLVGDSYRKSASALDVSLTEMAEDITAASSQEKISNRRRGHLNNARDYFTRAIVFYEKLAENEFSEVDRLHLRHSWLYLADCLFDLGRYSEAVGAYERASHHYQLTPTALIAFVQISNCHLKLGNPGKARSANERALWQLKKMSDEALASGTVGMTREEWEQWLKWTGKSGLW